MSMSICIPSRAAPSLPALSMAGRSPSTTRVSRRAVRGIHASRSYSSSKTLPCPSSLASEHATPSKLPMAEASAVREIPPATPAPLSILPLSSIVRSFMTTSISSSPILLGPSLKMMTVLAHSRSPLLSPDRNPILRFFLKHTFYKQFCAGESPREVRHTVDSLKSIGYKGVLLGYAREVVLDESQADGLEGCGEYEAAEVCIRNEITPWAKGTRETVELAGPDDFVSVKFTGAGSQALYDLKKNIDPSPALREAIDSICDLAAERGVRLLIDAEQTALQPGIDAWALAYMTKYNGKNGKRAVVYNTFQAYLKATPAVLAKQLEVARKGGFTLGVKLVRGAYLGSDPRHLIHDTKIDTDNCYDGISESLARRTYGPVLKAVTPGAEFPPVNVVLAGHNHNSVRKIQTLRASQAERGEQQIELVYAQLQGMADDVSCELVQVGKSLKHNKKGEVDIPMCYKYLVWGTTGECLKYLLRRAHENKDAVQRTREGRDAMAAELWRRIRGVFGATG